MFDRNENKAHQNPPRVFGPGSDMREHIEYQEVIIEELLGVLARHLPGESRKEVKALQERYEQGRKDLQRHQAIKILNGQGEHSALEHYMVRFQTANPPNNEPYPFPNPKSSIYRRLHQLLETHVLKNRSALRLKGAGRRRLEANEAITTADSDFYTDVNGDWVLILSTENAVAKWNFDGQITLVQHYPAQSFFMRTNVEELIFELFSVLNGRYSLTTMGDQPLTVEHLSATLETHLPRQFLVEPMGTYLQPMELQTLPMSPMTNIAQEHDALAKEQMGLRAKHNFHTHGVDHLFLLHVGPDGFISYTPFEGVTYWHYSRQEGVWVQIPEYLPYVAQSVFDEALQGFFDRRGYTPKQRIEAEQVSTLARSSCNGAPIKKNLKTVTQIKESGYYHITLEESGESQRILHLANPTSPTQLLVFLEEPNDDHHEVSVIDRKTGFTYSWDELNPTCQHYLLSTLEQWVDTSNQH